MLSCQNLVVDYQAGPSVSSHSAALNAGAAAGSVHTLALSHVSFQLAQGESVAVMGPSGSGKSTLLHAMAGIIRPNSGQVVYRGQELGALSDAERTKLRRTDFGFVFQSGQLLPELPAVENVALPLMLGGMDYRQAIQEAMQWLDRFGLAQLAQSRPGEMSGGQMQRVSIARALSIGPSVVFADEPTGALDQRTGHEVMGILTGAARSTGAAVIVVTHDPQVASYCSRTLTMRDGMFVSADSGMPSQSVVQSAVQSPAQEQPHNQGAQTQGGAR
nr:ABC transporter ATP-binding protein [Bombiscardovia apis]